MKSGFAAARVRGSRARGLLIAFGSVFLFCAVANGADVRLKLPEYSLIDPSKYGGIVKIPFSCDFAETMTLEVYGLRDVALKSRNAVDRISPRAVIVPGQVMTAEDTFAEWDFRDSSGATVEEGFYVFLLWSGFFPQRRDLKLLGVDFADSGPNISEVYHKYSGSDRQLVSWRTNTVTRSILFCGPKSELLPVRNMNEDSTLMSNFNFIAGGLLPSRKYRYFILARNVKNEASIFGPQEFTSDDTLPALFYFGKEPEAYSPATIEGYEDRGIEFAFRLSETGRMTVRIMDEKGVVVKNVSDEEVMYGDRITKYWNGRNNRGDFVRGGTYRIEIKGYAWAREEKRFNTVKDVFEIRYDTAPPLIGIEDIEPDPFSPNKDGVNDAAEITYSINKTMFLMMEVLDGNGEVKTKLFEKKIRNADRKKETNVFSEKWDGTDYMGDVLGDGVYVCRIRGYDLLGSNSNVCTGLIRIEKTGTEESRGRLRGTVSVSKRKDSGGVVIKLIGTALKAVTDKKGNFTLGEIPSGSYDILIKRNSCVAEYKKNVIIGAGKETALDTVEMKLTLTRAFRILMLEEKTADQSIQPAERRIKIFSEYLADLLSVPVKKTLEYSFNADLLKDKDVIICARKYLDNVRESLGHGPVLKSSDEKYYVFVEKDISEEIRGAVTGYLSSIRSFSERKQELKEFKIRDFAPVEE